jgi:LysM repeat protein
MFFISGCVIRTYTTEMDRVDQEIYGNKGFIMGSRPEPEEKPETRRTREIYNIEIELPSGYRTSQEIKDKELYGNRGYIKGGIAPEKEVCMSEGGMGQVSSRFSGGINSAGMPQIIYSESSSAGAGLQGRPLSEEGNVQYYVVQKNDTLQKISEKFFGTTKKWKAIYNANKNILKSPDRIRPGQKLAIPKE